MSPGAKEQFHPGTIAAPTQPVSPGMEKRRLRSNDPSVWDRGGRWQKVDERGKVVDWNRRKSSVQRQSRFHVEEITGEG